VLARGHRERLLGLWAVPPGCGLLVRSVSVHTFWMRRPVPMVGIGPAGAVRWSRIVPPRRLIFEPGTAWVAEVPHAAALPPAGSLLAARPILAGWPGS
jgi:hypothetical protein